MDVKREVLSFIHCNEKNGALLLTGKWGCGKTYLIRSIRDEINAEDKYIMILVSLFGVDSLESLNQKVKETVFNAMVGVSARDPKEKKRKKAKRILETISAAAAEVSTFAKTVNAVLSIKPYDLVTIDSEIPCKQGDEVINKRLVIVFDDFERSKLDIVELLGAINDYSENCGVKIVLVADEERIEEDKYKEFKEKLISRTVKLKDGSADVVRSIVENYKESSKGYQMFLKSNIDAILLVFCESKSENLRTLKSFLLDFERIYKIWMEGSVPCDNMAGVLYTFGAIMFEYKSNAYKKDAEYGYIFADKTVKEKYTRFNNNFSLYTLRKWITDGEWNEQEFLKEINKRFNPSKKTHDILFLYYDFRALSQDVAFSGLSIALKRAYEGQLDREELMHLLERIYLLKKYEITTPKEIDYDKVLQGIDSRETRMKSGEIIEDDRGTYVGTDVLSELGDKAEQVYRRIERLGDRCEAWNNRRLLLEYIQRRDISNAQLKYVCLVSLDDELLDAFLDAYRQGGNSEKRDLILTLKDIDFTNESVSTNENIQETIASLGKLATTIQKMLKSERDAIARINLIDAETVLNTMREKMQDAS